MSVASAKAASRPQPVDLSVDPKRKTPPLGRRIRLWNGKRLMGFEPTTFCMAMSIASKIPPRQSVLFPGHLRLQEARPRSECAGMCADMRASGHFPPEVPRTRPRVRAGRPACSRSAQPGRIVNFAYALGPPRPAPCAMRTGPVLRAAPRALSPEELLERVERAFIDG